MPISSLLLAAAVLVLVGLFLGRPLLLAPRNQQKRRSEHQELLSQKETLLAQIEILDFDFETGTMPELDYKKQRRQMVAQAAEMLERLDAYADVPAPSSNGSLDSEIEAAVAALRQPKVRRTPPTAPQTAVPQPQIPVPQPMAKPVTANNQVKFCSQCGQPVDEGDQFCAFCGNKIVHT